MAAVCTVISLLPQCNCNWGNPHELYAMKSLGSAANDVMHISAVGGRKGL